MKVTLEHFIPLAVCAKAVRMSHDNHEKSDTYKLGQTCVACNAGSYVQSGSYEITKDMHLLLVATTLQLISVVIETELIARVGNKLKHKSVLEQLVYTFDIDGISRACLQELARHRTARLTVKSTRYTLKELKDVSIIYVKDWCVLPDWDFPKLMEMHDLLYDALFAVQSMLRDGASNDIAKYLLPEAYKTHLMWQIDGRNMQNFLQLRTDKAALPEMQKLANLIYLNMPYGHRYLYEEYVHDNTDTGTDTAE